MAFNARLQLVSQSIYCSTLATFPLSVSLALSLSVCLQPSSPSTWEEKLCKNWKFWFIICKLLHYLSRTLLSCSFYSSLSLSLSFSLYSSKLSIGIEVHKYFLFNGGSFSFLLANFVTAIAIRLKAFWPRGAIVSASTPPSRAGILSRQSINF